ncbi:MAG TPA: hypothetical protein VMY38_05315 [Gemmatimonadaceae bacterium]|nr:hypothetical protein [Gemmatimonadaceae bacterium]
MRTALLCFSLWLHGGALAAQAPAARIVIVPTIGSDHQFNLDYSVAHLAALLDVIRPDGIIIDDASTWLARGCLLNAVPPEHHVALSHARTRGIPILGLRDWPPTGVTDPYAASERAMLGANQSARDTVASRAAWREQLDRRTAEIARLYSHAPSTTGLAELLTGGFAARERALSSQQRTAGAARAAMLADSVLRRIPAASSREWAIVVNWAVAVPLMRTLHGRAGVTIVPVESFLPLPPGRLEARLDRTHLSWILSSNLDEFYGMWAPQAFARERLADLMRRLEIIAPDDPVTHYMRARWLMQNRDFAAADTIFARLAALDADVSFPFPINGKWIRPPWRSVRRKAQLNHAHILDYQGKREDALAIYRELIALGPQLDAEARSFGFLYDDIQAAIRSYIDVPYTASQSEAFRHLLGTVRRPECAP